MAKTRLYFKFPVSVLIFILFWFSSCRSIKELPVVEAKPITTGRLLKKVEQSAFQYKDFTIKRINCVFSDDRSRTSFKVSLKATKDENILVSISKLNIPVGRVLLSPDSVKYVNYIERNYFVDDYSYLSSFLNIDLDFETVQAIISNNVFSYRNDLKNKEFKTFDSFIEDGLYVLQSEKNRKLDKLDERGKANKLERRLKRLDEDAFITQKMYFNPANFALTKLIIDDNTNDRQVELNFEDFTRVKNKDYPGTINMDFVSPENKVSLRIKMSGFSTEKISSYSFDIPEKYEQIRVD